MTELGLGLGISFSQPAKESSSAAPDRFFIVTLADLSVIESEIDPVTLRSVNHIHESAVVIYTPPDVVSVSATRSSDNRTVTATRAMAGDSYHPGFIAWIASLVADDEFITIAIGRA